MNARSRIAVAWLVASVLVVSMTACSRASRFSADSDSGYSAPSCSQLLDAAVAYERTGGGTSDINSTMQALSDNCADEYEIVADYMSSSVDSEFRIDSCDELLGYGIRREAVSLVEEDGNCSFAGSQAATAPEWPEGGLGWDQAREHVGTVQRVCGPLMSARVTADGTFVNVGRDYPSADRSTFIFWDIALEPIAPGAVICGAGEIYLYNGVTQIEMSDPGALEIWR